MSKLRQLIEAANRKCEMAWKVYSYNPEKDNELVDTSKAFDCIAAAQAHKREILEKNPNYTVEIIAESSQKNEDFYKYIDDVPTREIAKALKELGIKEPYATQKAKIADKLAKHFGLRRVPTPIEMTSILDALPYFAEESAQKNEDLSKHPKLKEIWSRWKFNTKYGLHYTSNAKDTQAYLAKITKPNTFWLEDEDTGKAIVQGTPKDLINFMLSHKNAIDESAQKSESKVNMSKLKNEIQAAVNKYFKDDKDLLEYVYIDTKKDKLGRDILEVRAELGYNDMVKLADHLDKIVTKYDRYAYFDQETSGIMTAVFESAQINESLRDLNLELADDTNAIAASADKIRQRFEYRTLQNQSYDEKQAEKIYLEIRRELEKAKKMIDACYNKIG